jgi:hypothetical protein
MIKSPTSLIVISAVFGVPGHSSAQEAFESDMGPSHVSAGMYPNLGYNSPFAPSLLPGSGSGHSPYPSFPAYSGIHGPGGPGPATSRALPRMLLPLPFNSPIWGFQARYGFQYPGSYLPAGTPLHRYNGYVVCDPPPAAAGKRIVKITTTRSLVAPGDTQPCPVYTVNGEIPKGKSYTTTTNMPEAVRNSP